MSDNTEMVRESSQELTAAELGILERLNAIKRLLTPAEKTLLGITEDLQSFAEIDGAHLFYAIADIIESAYEEVPAFRNMVNEDIAEDPNNYSRAAKLVSLLMTHLKHALPPEVSAVIQPNSNNQAYSIVKKTLEPMVPKEPEAVVKQLPDYVKQGPLDEKELSLFGLKPSQITPEITGQMLEKPIAFFLGKLKQEKDGRVLKVKNEATEELSDEQRKFLLGRLYKDIRDKKIQKNGKLQPFEERWLGKDIQQMVQIVHSLVEPLAKPKDKIYQSDTLEVMTQATQVLSLLNGMLSIISPSKRTVKEAAENSSVTSSIMEELNRLQSYVEKALPGVNEVEEYIRKIQEAVSKSDLTPAQLRMLIEVDPRAFSYSPADETSVDTLTAEYNKTKKEIEEKGPSPELEKNLTNTKKRLEDTQEVLKKDTKEIRSAVESYMTFLRKYFDENVRNISFKNMEKLRVLNGYASDLLRTFNRVAQEDKFILKWNQSGNRLFRDPSKYPSSEQNTAEATVKTAANISEYTEKVEKFFDGGPVRAIQKVKEYIGDNGLVLLRNRILSIIEASADNPLNTTGRDYRGNPEAGKEPALEEAKKLVSDIKNTIKKFDPDKIKGAAHDVLIWAADIEKFIRANPRKKKSSMDIVVAIRGFLTKFAEEESPSVDTEQILTKAVQDVQGPDKKRQESRRQPAGKAGWIIFRERLTKYGPKALPSYLEEPTFAREFIEEMESQGLNKMLLEGGKQEEKDIDYIDDIIAGIIGKGSGIGGNLENILGTKAMQSMSFERELEKAYKEYNEATARIVGAKGKDGKLSGGLRDKVMEVKKKYLPKIVKYTQFLMEPLQTVRDRIRTRMLEESKGTHEDTFKKDVKPEKAYYQPEDVQVHNFSSILSRLVNEYRVKDESAPTAKTAYDEWEAAAFDTKPVLPSGMYTKALLDIKRLENIQENIEAEKDPMQRAQQLKEYYEHIFDVFRTHNEYIASGMRDKMKADQQTLLNLKNFLASDAAKGMEADENKADTIAKARGLIPAIEAKISEEMKKIEALEAFLLVKESPEVVHTYEKRLTEVKKDLEDGKVVQLCEVAEAPQMNLSKEEANIVKEHQRKKWKDIQNITDIPTYKKNMAILTQKHIPSQGLKTPEKPSETKMLPSEAVDVLRRQNEENRKKLEEIDRMRDDNNKLFQEKKFYEKILEELPVLEAYITEKIKVIEKMSTYNSNYKIIMESKNRVSDEEFNKEYGNLEKLFTSDKDYLGVPDTVGLKDLEDVIKKEKSSIKLLEESYTRNKAHAIEYQQALKELNKKLSGQTPDTLEDLKKRLRVLKVTRGQPPIEQQADPRTLKPVEMRKDPKEPWSPTKPIDRNEARRVYRIDQQIAQIENKIKEMSSKTAATEDSWGQTPPSAFDVALESKGKIPKYMEHAILPKDWEVISNFYDNSLKELRDIEDAKKTGIEWKKEHTEEEQKKMVERMEELEKMIPAIDAYMKQVVSVGEENVPLKETAQRLDEILYEYLNLLRKYNTQLDDTEERQEYALQKVRDISQFFDPKTKEFKGFTDEEKENLKKIAYRMIYAQLDKYWSSRVGQQLSVFGDRDTSWYNNVYRTFRNMVETRSNRKLINLLTKYKQETRSDFDDDVNRYKQQELEKSKERIEERYKARGRDPKSDPEYNVLVTRIDQLAKQKKQIDRIFTAMAQSLQAKIHDSAKETFEKAIGEGAPSSSVDLSSITKEKVEEAASLLESDMTDITKFPEIAQTTEALLNKLEDKVGVVKDTKTQDTPKETIPPSEAEPPKESSEEKQPTYKYSKDFKQSILYGGHMQRTISNMIKESIKR